MSLKKPPPPDARPEPPAPGTGPGPGNSPTPRATTSSESPGSPHTSHAADIAGAPADSDTADPALVGVYRETVRPLHRFIARRCGGSRELIEDVIQEVYLRAIEVWHAGHPPREALPWLKALARNLLINYYRKHRPALVDPVLLGEATNPERPAATPSAVALIHWGLASLPDRHARLIEAFHLEGRSTREIAAAQGLSERAVEGRLHRARKALRKRLEPLMRNAGAEP